MRGALLLVSLLGCASTLRPPPLTDVGTLVDSREIPGEFMMRQRVEAHYPGRDLGFDAVLQRRDGVLTLLGLTPFGSRAFVLTQTGREVAFTSSLPMELPFPPRFMLMDIHRVFFVSLGRPLSGDGEREAVREGETVRETWRGGRLMERRFRRDHGQPAGEIVVAYGEGMVGRAPPRRISYVNGYNNYRLEITTLAYQTLARE